jgi:hypothetical protein
MMHAIVQTTLLADCNFHGVIELYAWIILLLPFFRNIAAAIMLCTSELSE